MSLTPAVWVNMGYSFFAPRLYSKSCLISPDVQPVSSVPLHDYIPQCPLQGLRWLLRALMAPDALPSWSLPQKWVAMWPMSAFPTRLSSTRGRTASSLLTLDIHSAWRKQTGLSLGAELCSNFCFSPLPPVCAHQKNQVPEELSNLARLTPWICGTAY